MLTLKNIVLVFTLLVSLCNALPASSAPSAIKPKSPCTSPIVRKEWSAATPAERASYTAAVLCLATKKSSIGLPSTLYDDFPWIHNKLNLHIHGVAAFLPWHRYFVHIYEKALQECGYIGHAMYWDWVADSGAPDQAKIWSPIDGFGGNGTDAATNIYTRCITTGPFTVLEPVYYGNDTHPHCITRFWQAAHPEVGLQAMIGWQYDAAVIATVNANTEYTAFHNALEGGPHGVVHAAIAGDMGPLTSPNDPIFFMHHTQVDRLWWLWQQVDPVNRVFDYSGIEFGGVTAELTDVMMVLGINGMPDRLVRDFMATNTSDLCYTYV